MSKHLPTRILSSAHGQIAGTGYRKITGYLLLMAMIAFSLSGNRPKSIVVAHQGDEHSVLAQASHHGNTHHEDEQHEDQHDGHERDSSEEPMHHHHVEVSPVLVIAVFSSGDLSIFQHFASLPITLADDICPPSPSSEIVKPPQVA